MAFKYDKVCLSAFLSAIYLYGNGNYFVRNKNLEVSISVSLLVVRNDILVCTPRHQWSRKNRVVADR